MQKTTISQALYRKIASQLLELVENGESLQIPLDKKEIFTNEDVIELFGFSKRTLSMLKAKKVLTYCKIGKRHYFLKTILLLDILRCYENGFLH